MRFIHFRENKDSSVQSRELTIAFERTGASKVNYGEIKFGLAYCSATDQFNRKIARRIAGGRCEKQRNNHKYELDGILEPLDNCNGKDMALETVISYVENLLLEGNCPLEFHGMELFAIDFPQLLPLANNYSKEVLPTEYVRIDKALKVPRHLYTDDGREIKI